MKTITHVIPKSSAVKDGQTGQTTSMFAAARRDVLVHHPHRTFFANYQLLTWQAMERPKVLAIKQTLYRSGAI
jgi:polyphosphate kinase